MIARAIGAATLLLLAGGCMGPGPNVPPERPTNAVPPPHGAAAQPPGGDALFRTGLPDVIEFGPGASGQEAVAGRDRL